MPKTGNFISIIDCKRVAHLLAVADGSPGPLDKKMPSGFNFLMDSTLVFSDKTVTLAF